MIILFKKNVTLNKAFKKNQTNQFYSKRVEKNL